MPTKSSKPQLLAQLFLDDRGHRLVYWRGRWWSWGGVCYHGVPDGALEAELCCWLAETFQALATTTRRFRDVLNMVRALSYIPHDREAPFSLVTGESSRGVITFQNGVVDVERLLKGHQTALRPHTDMWFSTVALPFDYDPEAKAPRWEAFAQQVFEGDSERIKFWHEWMGYCTIPSYQFQHAVILVGEGRNGKGVCLRTLEHLLGEENVSHVPLDLFGKRFQLIPTIGKLANVAGEISGSSKQAEEYLKMYTGGDPIYVDVKGKEGSDFKPTARLIFACNEIPPFTDRSDGIRRRLIVLPFNWQVPVGEVDKDLERKLIGELPGIFNLAMLGLKDLMARGSFSVPAASIKATAQHLLESNSARLFLSENTVTGSGIQVTCSSLYEAYLDYCREKRLQPVLNNIQFGVEVHRHYGSVVKKTQRRLGSVRQNVYLNMDLGTPDSLILQ